MLIFRGFLENRLTEYGRFWVSSPSRGTILRLRAHLAQHQRHSLCGDRRLRGMRSTLNRWDPRAYELRVEAMHGESGCGVRSDEPFGASKSPRV